MKFSHFQLIAIGMLLLSSCQYEPFVPTTPKEIAKDINEALDFNSHVTPTLTINAGRKAFIRVYDADPETNPNANPLRGVNTDEKGNFTGKFEVGSSLYGRTLYALSSDGEIKMSAELTKKGVTFVNKSAVRSRNAYISDNNKALCKELDRYFHQLLPTKEDNSANNLEKVKNNCQDINIHTTEPTEIAVSMVDYGDYYKNQLFYYYYKNDASKSSISDYFTPKQFYDTFASSTIGNKYRANPEYKNDGTSLEWCWVYNNTDEANDHREANKVESEPCDLGKTRHLMFYGENYNQAGTTEFPADYTIGFFMRVWVFQTGGDIPTGYYLIFTDGVGCYYEDLSMQPRYNNGVEIYNYNYFSIDFKNYQGYPWTNARCIFGKQYKNKFLEKKYDYYHFAAFQAEQGTGWPASIAGEFACPDHPGRTVSRIMYGVEDSLGYFVDSDFDDAMFMVTVEGKISDNFPKIPYAVENDEIYLNGTYCFEDLYPHQGDYDMNDVVVRYSYCVRYQVFKTLDDDNEVIAEEYMPTEVTASFTPYHNGAKYINDFHMSYIAANGDIVSNRTIYNNNKQKAGLISLSGSAYWVSLPGSNVEAGYIQKSGVEMNSLAADFCEDILRYFRNHPERFDPDHFFNISATAQDIEGNSINVYRGMNPYIYCTNTRRQIHMPKFEFVEDANNLTVKPTSEYERLYIIDIFSERYNQVFQMPFAIDIMSRSDYEPAPEKMPIYIAYPYFPEWATSSNNTSNAWMDQKTTDYPWVDWGPIE